VALAAQRRLAERGGDEQRVEPGQHLGQPRAALVAQRGGSLGLL
jgi:hypothetical protein